MDESPEATRPPAQTGPPEADGAAERRLRFERLLAEALVEDGDLLDRLAT
ncbi:hypothetical protein [Glycomyces endophyticus]